MAPFLVMGITTFQTDRDLYKRDANPFDYAEAPTLEHLDNLFNDTNYLAFVRNSAVVGAAVVAITLALALPAAYSLARLTGRWGERAGIMMFIVYLVPPTLLFIPLFRIIASLGSHQFTAVADPGLSHDHGAVQRLAADGLLQVDPAGDGGGGAGRRLPSLRGVPCAWRCRWRGRASSP